MKIKIVTVGKLKEKYLVQGINEYAKRLGHTQSLSLSKYRMKKHQKP